MQLKNHINMVLFVFVVLAAVSSQAVNPLVLSLKELANCPMKGGSKQIELSWRESYPRTGPQAAYVHSIKYELERSEDSNFSNPIVIYKSTESNTVDNMTTKILDVPDNKTYFFRVRAKWTFYRDKYEQTGDWSNTVSI